MDEIKAAQAQGRGQRAEELLRNELLQETIATLRSEYVSAWSRTSAKDTDARERLWQAYQIVGIVEEQLKKIAVDGRIATKDLAKVKYLKR